MTAVVILVTLAKLLLAAVWGHTADIPQTLAQAQAFVDGRDFLDPSATGGNPSFFPLGHYLIAAACLLLSKLTGLPFAWWIKTPAILADAAVAAILLRLPRGGQRAALLYLLNPVTFLLSVYHGQLHTVAMAGTVAALWLAEQGRPAGAGLALGLAASVRQHFGLLIAALWRAGQPRHRARAVVAFALTVAVVNGWLLASQHPAHLMAPTWTYGSWGYTLLLQHGPRALQWLGVAIPASGLDTVNRAIHDAGSMLYWAWTAGWMIWLWRRPAPVDLWRATLVLLLGLYVVSPGFGVQWLVWAVPCWIVVDRREAAGYLVLAGGFLIGSYWQWGLNARYGIGSVTASLGALQRADAAGVVLVGLLGVATWLYVTLAAWRRIRR